MNVEHELEIGADVDTVWALTVDIERWPDITPTMSSVERLDDGPLTAGSRAKVVQPRQRPRVWTVTKVEAPHLFVWSTTVGPLAMVASHRIDATSDGCRNTLTVELSGTGAKLFGRLLRGQLEKAIRTENEGFRRAAEAAAGE